MLFDSGYSVIIEAIDIFTRSLIVYYALCKDNIFFLYRIVV